MLRILTDRLQGEDWGEAKQAAIWLACTRSQQAPPALLAALTHPSWEVVQAAIEALAAWLDKDAAVRAALAEVAKAHWSGLVRAQARQALDGPEGPPEPDRPESDDQVMVVLGGCFHRCLTDHLNAVCGVDGEVVDGIYQSPRLGQFQVVWQRARRNPAPMGFPIVLSEDLDRTAYGTSSYLTVDDGWLVGTDRWHYDGVIGHVSHAGEVQPIGELGEDAAAILDTPQLGRIVLGGSVFGLGKGGLLASIHAGEEGWSMRYRASLPSPPWAWAFAPDGTLLVADPHNAVAVHADWSLEALSCPTIVPASMPKRVLSVARRAADSPLPVRHREAVVRVAVLEPIVERRRLALLQSHNGPQQGESGQPLECIQEDYQDVVQELVDAKQHQGDSAGALALLDESLCDADAINVGQRANLLADLGRPQEALAYLQAHPYVEQYVAQFLLTALALIEGDSNAARKHLDRAQNALDGESIPGLFEPDRRYADMLSLIVNPSNTVFASTPELDQGGWPEPLMRYLQGEISEAQLVPELYRRDGQVDRERLCEALVYLGMREAATGRHVHSRRYFRAAVRLSVYDFMEHTVALLALSRE
ncbi:MAG: HEAT repeat domain-containing protein [Xanthomonadales bacterium]|nr:HEAT repeat domain-containing protein [Xanthomonadales bacterium]